MPNEDALLDMLDPDPDLEPEEDAGIEDDPGELDISEGETSLGWANEGSQLRLHAEQNGDEREPTLGATGCVNGTDHFAGWSRPTPLSTDECEEENEHGDTADEEPSLGATNGVDQSKTWRKASGYGYLDLEFEGEGRPECDKEPSLGSLTSCWNEGPQTLWACGANDDREHEHDGREPEE